MAFLLVPRLLPDEKSSRNAVERAERSSPSNLLCSHAENDFLEPSLPPPCDSDGAFLQSILCSLFLKKLEDMRLLYPRKSFVSLLRDIV